ncbi:MAG: TetR/AcrR family transcriptional regulator [Pseudomonadota bacterium]
MADPRASRSHRALLDSAIALLLENPTASMSDISKTAGVGRATLYRHFESRDALILELALESLQLTDEILKPIRDTSLSAKDQLSQGLTAIMAVADRYHFLLLLWQMSYDDDRINTIYLAQLDELSTLVERGKSEQSISSDFSTSWVVSLIDSLIYAGWWEIKNGEMTAEQAGKQLVQTLFNGIQ